MYVVLDELKFLEIFGYFWKRGEREKNDLGCAISSFAQRINGRDGRREGERERKREQTFRRVFFGGRVAYHRRLCTIPIFTRNTLIMLLARVCESACVCACVCVYVRVGRALLSGGPPIDRARCGTRTLIPLL